jgi:colanic acid/amylovoran biosynthesis glycosyltransferase
LKIIIFDGSFKTTPFINRLVKGLAGKHAVYVLGFNEQLPKPIGGVTYVSLGSNQNKLRFAGTTLGRVFKAGKFNLLFSTLQRIVQGMRQELQQQNLDLALKTIAPDIIHLQWPSVIPWFEEVLIEQKIPVVLSQRGFHNNVRPFVDEANFEYLKKWYPKMAGFHSVSQAMAATGDKIWNAPEKLNRVVHTGLDLNRLSISGSYSQKSPIQMLSIGRAHWIKGYDYALRACRILKEKNIAFKYTIIGGAGDEELQFLIHDLGLAAEVVLEKRLPQTEVFQRMQEASILLMPSLEEGIPNVVVEAMALGLPVISTDCGGVPELIEDGVNGWIVPTRDPKAMAAAGIHFVGLPIDKIEKVRIEARRKVEQQHNKELMIQGMEELYYKVLREQ